MIRRSYFWTTSWAQESSIIQVKAHASFEQNAVFESRLPFTAVLKFGKPDSCRLVTEKARGWVVGYQTLGDYTFLS